MARLKGSFAYRVDIGKVRITNEDQANIIINPNGDVLMLVCDGMGGHNKGDFAANTAIEILSEAFKKTTRFYIPYLTKRWLTRQIKIANQEIYRASLTNETYKDMGTTLVAALLTEKHIIVANIGDSRAYFVLPTELQKLTEDQSYVEYLYRTGKITKEEMKTHPKRHVLMNALGIYPSLTLELLSFANQGHPLLLCSDGLYNNITNQEMLAILLTNERPEQKIRTLIQVANANGGSDNIAISYWESNSDD